MRSPGEVAVGDTNNSAFPKELQSKWIRIPADLKPPELDQVLEMLAELYEVYYRHDSDVTRHRADVETALGRLMMMYNAYLD